MCVPGSRRWAALAAVLGFVTLTLLMAAALIASAGVGSLLVVGLGTRQWLALSRRRTHPAEVPVLVGAALAGEVR